jgi:glutathione S-transferase
VYELFYYPDNASLAPHFVLEEIGAPFTLTLVDRTRNEQKSPQYLERNPLGRIPTLVYDHVVLFESAAICLHLADRHPEARLAPAVASDARAHLYKWLMFLTNTIQPDHMAFFYADRYTADPRGAVAVSAAAEERLGQAYAAVDAALQREGPDGARSSATIRNIFRASAVAPNCCCSVRPCSAQRSPNSSSRSTELPTPDGTRPEMERPASPIDSARSFTVIFVARNSTQRGLEAWRTRNN